MKFFVLFFILLFFKIAFAKDQRAIDFCITNIPNELVCNERNEDCVCFKYYDKKLGFNDAQKKI